MKAKLTAQKRLEVLDEFLISDLVDEGTMLLSELDGFIAGIIVHPELIMPGEWFPHIWGEGEPPTFESEKHAEEILGHVMEHYNHSISQLDRDRFAPIYEIDTDDSAIWEIWMEGFGKAMELANGWKRMAQLPHQEAAKASLLLKRYYELSHPQRQKEALEVDDKFHKEAADMIPFAVQSLFDATRKGAPLQPANNNQPKIGRNSPCLCGSGKKFKKCCLN